MRISTLLQEKKNGVSFEFFPPRTIEAKESFMHAVQALNQHNPLYASVTCGAGGTTRERTANTLKWIKETGVVVMAHVTCIGETRASMDNLLRNYIIEGIDNILALRGDTPRNAPEFDPSIGEFKYAKDLVAFARSYDRFSIAVAVYPEGHQESSSIEKDMEYTKQKIDAGADFGITQMFFDNRYYYDFIERATKAGINIPIIPGIMPITDCMRVVEFATLCSATIPSEARERMTRIAGRPEEELKFGIEHAVAQCEDLLANGARHLHFYTLNKSEAVSAILAALASYLS